jgi:hypothetical protein
MKSIPLKDRALTLLELATRNDSEVTSRIAIGYALLEVGRQIYEYGREKSYQTYLKEHNGDE